MAVDWRAVALVAIGGALGALARFGVSSLLPTRAFPWHTLLANLAGAFALGALVLDHGAEHRARLFIAVGFLGAFTTLSTYSAETVDLWRSGHAGLALANVLGNGLGGPVMAFIGWKTAALA